MGPFYFETTEKITPSAMSAAPLGLSLATGSIVFPTGRVVEGRLPTDTKFVGFYPEPPGDYFAAVVTGTLPDANVRDKVSTNVFGTDGGPMAATLGSMVIFFLYVDLSWVRSGGALRTAIVAAADGTQEPGLWVPGDITNEDTDTADYVVLLIIVLSQA